MPCTSIRLICGILLAFTFLDISSRSAHADFVDLAATKDARVLSFFPNSNENSVLLSVFNNGSNNIQRTYLEFDLQPYAGDPLDGDGMLILSVFANLGTELIDGQLFLAAGVWDENTITWNNQPGASGAVLSTTSGTFPGETQVTWTVPQAILQAWINNPSSNFGLVVVSAPGSDVSFHSKESSGGAFAPRLSFNTIPEPAMILPAFCFTMGLVLRQRTRR